MTTGIKSIIEQLQQMRNDDALQIEHLERVNRNLTNMINESENERENLIIENTKLNNTINIWLISHGEQRKKIVNFLRHIEKYPVQYTPGLRAEIENMINHYSK